MKHLKYFLLVVVIILDGYLIYHSTLSGNKSAQKSEELTDVVIEIVEPGNDTSALHRFSYQKIHSFIRKLFGHFGAFMFISFIGFITCFLFTKRKVLIIGFTLLNGLLMALLTEGIQLFIEGRVGSFKDVLIDISGCLLAILISTLILLIINTIKKKRVEKYEKEYI